MFHNDFLALKPPITLVTRQGSVLQTPQSAQDLPELPRLDDDYVFRGQGFILTPQEIQTFLTTGSVQGIAQSRFAPASLRMSLLNKRFLVDAVAAVREWYTDKTLKPAPPKPIGLCRLVALPQPKRSAKALQRLLNPSKGSQSAVPATGQGFTQSPPPSKPPLPKINLAELVDDAYAGGYLTNGDVLMLHWTSKGLSRDKIMRSLQLDEAKFEAQMQRIKLILGIPKQEPLETYLPKTLPPEWIPRL